MLAGTITGKSLEPVAWQSKQIIQGCCRIQSFESNRGLVFYVRKGFDIIASREFLRPFVAVGLDHVTLRKDFDSLLRNI